MFFKVLILSSFALAHQTSNANPQQDCSAIRLDDRGYPMEQVPPTDQGQYGVCYAVAAEGLYDAYRLKQDPSAKASSAFHAAIAPSIDEILVSANVSLRPINTDGGLIHKTLQSLIDSGGCERSYFAGKYDKNEFATELNSIIESTAKLQASSRIKDRPLLPKKTYTGLEWAHSYDQQNRFAHDSKILVAQSVYKKSKTMLQERLHALSCSKDGSGLLESQTTALQLLESGTANAVYALLKKISCPVAHQTKTTKKPKISGADLLSPKMKALAEMLEAELAYLNEALQNQYITNEEAIARAYELRMLYINSLKSPESVAYAKQAMHQFVGKTLITQKMPIAIGYCANQVMSGIEKVSAQNTCGAHASLIIGRKWDESSQTCKVLVRNSWGKGKWYTYRRGVERDAENYWISEDVLYASMEKGLLEGWALE